MNIRFDQVVKSFSFTQNLDESCVYKKSQGKVVAFLVLYVDDILLIGNDVGMLSTVKVGIKIFRDRKRWIMGIS